MAKHCGGNRGAGAKTVSARPHQRSKPGPACFGPGKPGPKTVRVRGHNRSRA